MSRQYRTTSNADSRALTVRLHKDSYEALEVAAGLLRVSMASLVEEAWEYYRGSKVFRRKAAVVTDHHRQVIERLGGGQEA